MTDVDVVIPVRNGGRLLQRAVDSILTQEGVEVRVIVVDDGSTDGAPQRLRPDPRVRVLRATGRGIPAALEQGVQAGQAPYVARQDADDVSLPGRLAAQVEHLDRHSGIGLVATAFEVLVGQKVVTTMTPLPSRLPDVNPFCAGSVVTRRVVHDAVGGYRAVFACASDYDMWLRCAEVAGVTILTRPGYRYRLTADMTTIRSAARQAAYADLARASTIARREESPDPADDDETAEAFVQSRLGDDPTPDPEVFAWWAVEFAALGDRREAIRCLRQARRLPARRMLAVTRRVLVPGAPQADWS